MTRKVIVLMLVAPLFLAWHASRLRTPQNKTIENLKIATTASINATQAYAAYAVKALTEGRGRTALVFMAASRSEALQANLYAALLKKKNIRMDPIRPRFKTRSTRENLVRSLENTVQLIEHDYPDFIRFAETSKNDDAREIFRNALTIAIKQHRMFTAASKTKDTDARSLPGIYFVCPRCGNIFQDTPPDQCELCYEARAGFIEIK